MLNNKITVCGLVLALVFCLGTGCQKKLNAGKPAAKPGKPVVQNPIGSDEYWRAKLPPRHSGAVKYFKYEGTGEYKMPLHLVRKVGKAAIKYRGGDNVKNFTGWKTPYLAMLENIPGVYGGDEAYRKKIKEMIKANQQKLREKIIKAKSRGVELRMIFRSIIHVPKWASKNFFEAHPEAHPVYSRFRIAGIKERKKRKKIRPAAPYLCPDHPLAMKILAAQIQEPLRAIPEINAVLIVIGDNGGSVSCGNPAHKHDKFPGGYDEWEKDAAVRAINTTYKAMKQANPKAVLIVRLWCQARFILHEYDKYKDRLPNDIIWGCKHSSPPAGDYCWNPTEYTPALKKFSHIFSIFGWGENRGIKSGQPTAILYACPEIIQRDVKHFTDTGRLAIASVYCSIFPEQELQALAAKSCAWNPNFDMQKLKEDWAKYRFGDAGKHVLKALSYSPKALAKLTLYQTGQWASNSLQIANWNTSKGYYPQAKPTPKWIRYPDIKKLDWLEDRLDARDLIEKMILNLKKVQKMRPNDEMIRFYVRKAEQSLELARMFRGYHLGMAYYNLAVKFSKSDLVRAKGFQAKALGLFNEAKVATKNFFDGPATYTGWAPKKKAFTWHKKARGSAFKYEPYIERGIKSVKSLQIESIK
ncbi:MAG: hypothetical protein K8S55_03540 [Phycisphaerae bacterium]|nr:hypothetical protein [Phycisphaerae bacterium]